MDLKDFKLMKGVSWDKVKPQYRKFPMLQSPKIDGFRCFVHGGIARLSSKDPVPNVHIRHHLSRSKLSGMDGELVAGDAHGAGVINRTQKLVSSHHRFGDWTFHVFDNWTYPGNYARRLSQLTSVVDELNLPFIQLVHHEIVSNEADIERLDLDHIAQGYEGSILRDPDAAYDFGRCTPREAYMIKLKQYHDEEAKIVGFEEKMHNSNPLSVDPSTGRKSRSSAGDCKMPLGTLGAFILRHPKTGLTFKCGSGLNDAEAAHFWQHRDEILGQWVTYKTMGYGVKDVPRHPIFKCIRPRVDIEPSSIAAQGELL